MTGKEKTDIYQIVTDKILECLDRGDIPWQKTWESPDMLPKNLITKKSYRGINIWLLMMNDYKSPWWMAYKQALELGGCVRKGEHGTMIVYWNWVTSKDEDTEDEKKIPFLRYYTVFNAEQIDGIEDKIPQVKVRDFNPIEACENIIKNMPDPKVEVRNNLMTNTPFYHTKEDYIGMPYRSAFMYEEHYYVTLFHELIHATGSENRLNRKSLVERTEFGSKGYSKEELIAELGSAFICSLAGIDINKTILNQAAYIQSWMKRISEDKRLVIFAASQAQRAVDWVLKDNVLYNNNNNKEEK